MHMYYTDGNMLKLVMILTFLMFGILFPMLFFCVDIHFLSYFEYCMAKNFRVVAKTAQKLVFQ